jgi:hypothetical protein
VRETEAEAMAFIVGIAIGIRIGPRTASSVNKRPAARPSRKFSSKELAYREFPMYTTFYAPVLPVTVAEGDTDNVYLTPAIRSLALEFPDLAEVMPDKKIRLKVRIYKFPKSSTARLLDLKDGGSGGLAEVSCGLQEVDESLRAGYGGAGHRRL